MNEFNEASYQGYYIQPRVCWGGAFEFDLNWVSTSDGYCLKYFHNIPFFNYVKKNFCSLCIDHLINLHLFKHELGNFTCKQFNRKNNHSDL